MVHLNCFWYSIFFCCVNENILLEKIINALPVTVRVLYLWLRGRKKNQDPPVLLRFSFEYFCDNLLPN